MYFRAPSRLLAPTQKSKMPTNGDNKTLRKGTLAGFRHTNLLGPTSNFHFIHPQKEIIVSLFEKCWFCGHDITSPNVHGFPTTPFCARQQQIQKLQELHTCYLRLLACFPNLSVNCIASVVVSEADQLTIGSDCTGVIPACRNILSPHLSEIRWHIALSCPQGSIQSRPTEHRFRLHTCDWRLLQSPQLVPNPLAHCIVHRYSVQSKPTEHRFRLHTCDWRLLQSPQLVPNPSAHCIVRRSYVQSKPTDHRFWLHTCDLACCNRHNWSQILRHIALSIVILSKANQLTIASDCTRVTGPAAVATTGPKSFGTLHCPSLFSPKQTN